PTPFYSIIFQLSCKLFIALQLLQLHDISSIMCVTSIFFVTSKCVTGCLSIHGRGLEAMHKSIARGLFYGVATVLILWTASLTYTFVKTALPQVHWVVPLFALVVFDVGMLAWLKVFLDYAQGSGQRAVALIMCLVDFLGVGLMVLSEILLGGQTMVTAPENLGEYAIWGIAIWTVINVGAII